MTIFFSNWDSILRTLILTTLGFITMVGFIRLSGKRTLSKMNAFDFIITIALGSTLATISLNKDVALAEGAVAIFLLIFIQNVITWLSVRHQWVRNIVTSQPKLLLYKGQLLEQNMKKERITHDEIYQAIRGKGLSKLQDVGAIVLETTGKLTIIPEAQTLEDPALQHVRKGELR